MEYALGMIETDSNFSKMALVTRGDKEILWEAFDTIQELEDEHLK